MKPKVLLAGGTGYIGKYLSEVIEMMLNFLLYQNIQTIKKQMMLK